MTRSRLSSSKTGDATYGSSRMGETEKEQLHAIGQRLRTTFTTVKSLLPQLQEQEIFLNAFENARQRFDLWAVNLGLYTSGHSSLEYRLGDAPLIYIYALQALTDLQRYLDIISQDLQQKSKDKVTPAGLSGQTKVADTLDEPSGGDLDDSDEEEFESYQDSSLTETALENVNGIIDSLYRLSFKIRNPATRLGFSKAQKYREIDNETGVDLIQIFADFDRQHIEEVFRELRKGQEPKDAKEHYLVERLAKANTRRRQQFKQWRTHRIKIEAISNTAEDFDFLIPSSKTAEMAQAPVSEGMLASGQPAPSMPSTATRLDPAVVTLDDTTSIISTSTSTGLEDDLNSDDSASAAAADDSERHREDDSDALAFSDEERRPSEAVYGVDYNDVGNRLDDLDPYELTPDKRQLHDDWNVVHNPKLPRELNIDLEHSILHDSVVSCVRFSSDSLWVAVGFKLSALIYEVETGREIFNFTMDDTDEEIYVRGVSFDTEVVHLAVGAEDKLIRVFHIETGALIITLAGHKEDIYDVDFITNSSLLLSGSGDRTVRLWDIQTGAEKLKRTLSDGVTSVAHSPDGKFFAACCLDRTATIWDLAGTGLKRLSGTEGHTDSIYGIAFSPDGQSIVTASLDKTLKLWDLKGQLERVIEHFLTSDCSFSGAVRTLTGHKDFVLNAVFTKDGSWVISNSKDRGIQFWNPTTGDAALRINAHKNSVVQIDTSPTGNLFATVSGDKSLKIWRYTWTARKEYLVSLISETH
ncbi:MAG: hypothetical protein Q9208_000247 [Pyrenodesmia sp. 3 TL-2023]